MRYKLFTIYGSLVTLAACTSFAILKWSQPPEALSLIQCQLVELRPDPIDCSKFYNCSPNGTQVFQCPVGLHFNTTKLVCEFADQARCTTNDQENATTLSTETSYTDEIPADLTEVSVVEFETERDYYTTDNALDESSRDGTSETPVITGSIDDVKTVTEQMLLNITSNYKEINTNDQILSPINNLTVSGHEVLTGTSSKSTTIDFNNPKYSTSGKSSSEFDISSSYTIKTDTNDSTTYIVNINATEPTKDYTYRDVIENFQFSSDISQLEPQKNVDNIELYIEVSSNGNINSQPTDQLTSIPFNELTDETNSSKIDYYQDLYSLEENDENTVGSSTYNPENEPIPTKLATNIHTIAYDRQKDKEDTTSDSLIDSTNLTSEDADDINNITEISSPVAKYDNQEVNILSTQVSFEESQSSTATSENNVNAAEEIVENDTEYPIQKVKSGLSTNFGLEETEYDNIDTDNIELYNDKNIHHQYSEIEISTISSMIEEDSKLVPTDYDNNSKIHVLSTVRHFDTNTSSETFEKTTDLANSENYISSTASPFDNYDERFSISSETLYTVNDSNFDDMKSNLTNNYLSDSDDKYINENRLSTDSVKQQNEIDRSANITENVSVPTKPSDINALEITSDLPYTSIFVDQELVEVNRSSSIQEITTDFFENEESVRLSTVTEESDVSRDIKNMDSTTKLLEIINTNFSLEVVDNTNTENIMSSTIVLYSQKANDENLNKTLSTDLLESVEKQYATTIGDFLYSNQGFTSTSNISVSPINENNRTKQIKTSTDLDREGLNKATKQSITHIPILSTELLRSLKYEYEHSVSYLSNKSSTLITIISSSRNTTRTTSSYTKVNSMKTFSGISEETNMLQISSKLYSSINTKTKNMYSGKHENYEEYDATEMKESDKFKTRRNGFGVNNNAVNYGDDTNGNTVKNYNIVEDDEDIDSSEKTNANENTLEDSKKRDNLKEANTKYSYMKEENIKGNTKDNTDDDNKNENNTKKDDTNEANVQDVNKKEGETEEDYSIENKRKENNTLEDNIYEDNMNEYDMNEDNTKEDNTEENNNEDDNTKENDTEEDIKDEDNTRENNNNTKEDNKNDDYTADDNTEEDITYEGNTDERSGTKQNGKYNIDDDTHEETVKDLEDNDRSGVENTNEESAGDPFNCDNTHEDITNESDGSKYDIFNDSNDEDADSKDDSNEDNTKEDKANNDNIFQRYGNTIEDSMNYPNSEYNDKVNEEEYHLRRLLETNKSVTKRNNGRNHNNRNDRKQFNNRSYRKNKKKNNDRNRNEKSSLGQKRERRNQQNSYRYKPKSKEDIAVTQGNINLRNNQNRNKSKSSRCNRKWRTLDNNKNGKEGKGKSKGKHALILNIKKVIFEKSLKEINWEL